MVNNLEVRDLVGSEAEAAGNMAALQLWGFEEGSQDHEEMIDKYQNPGFGRVLGLFENERLIGASRVIVEPNTVLQEAYLSDIVIDEAHRGLGKGEDFMRFIIDLVVEKGWTVLETVPLTEGAERFFVKKFGFAEDDEYEEGSLILRL